MGDVFNRLFQLLVTLHIGGIPVGFQKMSPEYNSQRFRVETEIARIWFPIKKDQTKQWIKFVVNKTKTSR